MNVLAVAAVLAVTLAPAAPAVTPMGTSVTAVSFVGSGGVVLHGSVVAPEDPVARRMPGVVMLSGAGATGRSELMPEAEAFARHGIVTLVYDKRTEDYSLFHRDYSELADDALAGVRLLRSRPGVDPARVGLWGLSEGAFVAPLAAGRSTDVAFVITVGAVGVTPAAQTSWMYGEFLGHDGVTGSLRHTMQSTATRVVVAAGLFPEADFDPVPAWEHVRQPVLMQWGRFDRQALPAQSSTIITRALRRGGNTHYTTRFVAGADHDLYLTADGGFDRTTDLPRDYGEFEAAWIADPAPGSVGVPPRQDAAGQPVTPPAWYESPGVQAAAILLFLLAFAAYPVSAAVRRLFGRRATPPVARPARWLAATGLITTIGFVGYVFFLLATGANLVGPVVLGDPIPWLVLRILVVATIAATVVTTVQWRRHGHRADRCHRIRLGLLVTAGVVLVPWSICWGLL